MLGQDHRLQVRSFITREVLTPKLAFVGIVNQHGAQLPRRTMGARTAAFGWRPAFALSPSPVSLKQLWWSVRLSVCL
jgi:hypothetical protein